MSNRKSSLRIAFTIIVIIAISAVTYASPWSTALSYLGITSAGPENVSEPVTANAVMTAGTCGEFGGLAIEVEASGGTNLSYATLKEAFDAINAGAHTGTITIDVCADTTEPTVVAAPSVLLNASGVGSASYTSITMSPAGGAARTISGAATAGFPLIDLVGADNLTIDGLNAGGNSLTIENTTVSATSATSTIRFIGGATNNTITNSNLKGAKTASVATNGAVVTFSTDALTANGNDNNTISNNNIGPSGVNLPTTGIQCNGSTTTTAIGNSGIVINNNNIFDYFGAAVTSAGVAVNGGCNALSITNNRFYQTATRTWTTGAVHTGILLNSTTATSGVQGMTVTGNTIGYASNTQTGTYTLTGAGTGAKFVGITHNGISTGAVSTISNNTVAAVSLTGVTSSGTSTSSPFIGIFFQEGNGVTNNNTIGSQSATGSLTFSTTTTSSTDVYGIYNFSSNAWTSNNNNVGGISVTNLGASGTFLVYGMRAFTGSTTTWTAGSNNIGGTVANSIQLAGTGTLSQVVGMFTSNAPTVLTSNTIRNLTTNIGTGTTSSASVIGINLTSSTPNQTLSQNTIHSLTNTNTTAASIVTGIQFTGGTANVVERNFIYGLTSATNSATAEINGIRVAGGTTTYRNNMIALGANQAVSIGSAASNSGTTGINGFNGALGTDSFLHNSIYIGGSATSGAGASYAFNGTQTVNTRSFRDNIFYNARSNSGATGSNYAVKINGTTANPTGLTINNNLYFVNGTGGVFGYFNGLDVPDINTWRTNVGQDVGSYFANPQFNDPTNAVPDLHLHPTIATVAEGNGVDVGVTNDFDGQVRASLTPVDIGADAGNFSGIDLAPPGIAYTALANTNLTTNRVLSVTLTDVSGVATGGDAPRVYFNKNAGTYSSTACSLAGGTVQNGTWTCTIDNSLIGGVVTADVVRYFVVAQDISGNLGSNPSAGFSGTNVNTVTTPPTTPNSYLIAQAISGTRTVCASGCDYSSLTGATGIFKAINDGVATGNINIEIAGDLTTGEDGTNGLNALAEQPSGSNFTVKIYPTGSARVITGAANTALIRTIGASRVTIDGSIGGTGTDRSLTITNTSVTTPSVILFGSTGTTPIANNTLKNCIVINGANTSSAVVISDGTTLGNAGYFSNITIQNNDIQKAFIGVFATGGTTPQGGSNLVYTQNKVDTSGANAVRISGLYMQGVNGATVSNNTVGNFSNVEGESDTGIWLATGTTNATVSGNSVSGLGMTLTTGFAPYGIRESSGSTASGNTISGNTITNLTTTGSTGIRGIAASSSGVTIERNNISNIQNNNTGTFGSFGIDITAGNDDVIKNNFISDVNHNMTGGAAFGPDFGVVGIRLGAGTGHKVYNNSVNLFGPHSGTATTSLLSAAFSISTTAQTGIDVRDNIFANNITGGTTSIAHVSVYLPSGGTSAMNLTWNNNSYYFGTDATKQGTGQAGTTAGTNFFTTLPLMAAYTSGLSPAATNDNASIASSGPVPFSSATDLHISVGAPEVNAGVAIAGVNNDFDGDGRPGNLGSEIGADEIADVNAPDTTILTNPTNPSNTNSAIFTFSGTDTLVSSTEPKGDGTGSRSENDAPSALAGFECRIDAGAWASCTSGITYNSLTQGSHTFDVRAKDANNNVDPSPATYTWVVDTVAPTTSLDSFPTNPSSSTSAAFTFSAVDPAPASGVAGFECKLDAGAYAVCTSPANVTGLSQGSHTFSVRSTDAAGNVSVEALYTWTVDAIAPDTQILTNPTDPSNSANATFTFSGTDSAIATVASFECQIDGGAFGACTSPKNYTGLTDGSHTFQVRAKDTAGNVDPSPASFTWTISTGPAGPVVVTATAGTPGPTSYATVKDAFDAINAGTHQGSITIAIIGDTTEAASAVLNESGSGSASYTAISIQPSGGAARTVTGNIAGHLIDLNGADNVSFNGLNTGGNSLTISNTSQQVTASTIRFVNDATNNTVTNSTVSGATGAALSSGFGVIYFATGTVTGNDGNIISNNNITGAGGAQPINGIYSFGTSAAIDNSGITVSGNNISDYFNANSSSNGINANTGNSAWTITNNKFFQTGARTYLTAATHNGINVLSGSGYTITGNTIGYAAANGTGVYTMGGTVATRFVAINLAVGTTATTSVQGNSVASISLTGIGTNSGSGSLAGVSVTSGNVNIGNVTPNNFGSTSGTGSLTTTPTTTTAAAIIGVNSATTGTIVISNNTFGAFTSASPTAANPGAVFGVNVSAIAASITVTGNTFGNSTAENMRAGVLGTTTGSSIAGAIIQTAIPSVFNYSNNTIRNFSSYGTGTGGYVRGIQTNTSSSATATGTINNNTITNLITSGAVSGQSSANTSAQGIQFLAGVNTTISGNTISNISNVNAGAVGTVVAGIVHASGTNSVISNNRIWGLSNASTTTSTTLPNVIAGIIIRSGTTSTTVVNNMISLGAGQATNSYIFGIWGNHGSTPDPLDQVYFNTVNIEGTVASGAAPSAGFHRGDLTTTNKNPVVDVRNNVFVNTRSGGTGKHYAIANHIGGTSSTATGWTTVNNNVLNANPATIGFWTTDQTFAGWKAASGGDGLSYSGITVNFVNAAAGDLHVNMGVTPTSLESGGVAIAGITTDIDGQTRPGPAGSTNGGAIAPDLGADEFDGVYLDGAAPIITYTNLSNTTSTANRTLSVNITDGTGVAGGGNSPRVYFKKSTDAVYASSACSLASGTPQNGSYNCVIDNSLVGGGTVATGDTIQYFVVAQDTVGNLAASPSLGFSGVNVNTVTTPPTTPNSYIISIAYTGNYDVGTGGAFTSLTNPGGIFEALNAGVVTGNVNINIISDLTGETGTVSLNQTTEEGAGGYTIKIQPTGAPRSITGSSNSWIIRLADADRVTIDGSLSGGTAVGVGGDPGLRNLTIQNTSTTATAGAVIVMSAVSNGAQNNTVRNVNISGQDPAQTLIGMQIGGAGVGTAGGPNHNARVENCSFQKSIIGLYDAGANSALQNTGHVVTMNDLSSTGANRLRRSGMLFFNANGLQVTKNSIGGIVGDESIDTYGIGVGIQAYDTTTVLSGAVTNSLISGNKVNGVSSTNTTGFSAIGIGIAGGTTGANVVANNMVTGVMAPSTSPDLVAGIYVAGAAGSSTKLLFNSVAMTGDRGAVASQIGSYGVAITGVDPTVELKNNVLYTTQTSGGGANAKSYAIGMVTTTFANLDSNYNDFVSTGANAGGFRTAGLAATGTDFATLSAWQTAVSDDANSLAVDPTFVDPLVNLHLQSGSPMVGAGTAAGGITVDFDGDTRDATPDIGADELDTTAPDTQILTTPSNPSNSSSATFTFTGTDSVIAAVASFECQIDGGGFSACTSPQSYTGLSQGSHTFQVRAKDGAGNVDPTPASFTWTVDAIAPDTQILTNPTDPSNSSNATFTFSGTDSLGVPAITFECQIDGGGFSACTSPKNYTGLADGSHTFQVRAKDAVGNVDPTPASYTWTINTVPASPVTVTATAGTTGPTGYNTVKEAFDAINAGTHQGAVTVSVNANTTETASAVLNASGGTSAYTSVLVRPTAVVSVSGNIVGAVIKLNGADNVTIDGRIGGTGSSRDLTVANTANTTATAAIWLSSLGAGAGASGNTIRNVELAGGAPQNTGTLSTYGIIMSGTAISTTSNGEDNDNNSFIANRIIRVRYGILTRGLTTNLNANPIVTDNIIGPAAFGADAIGKVGIFMQADSGATVSRNTIQFVGGDFANTSGGADRVGIAIGADAWGSTPTTLLGTGYTVSRNVIHDVIEERTFSSVGIYLGAVNGTSPTGNVVANNFVYNVKANGTLGDTGVGIGIAGGNGDSVVFNSVRMEGDMDPNAGATAPTQTSANMRIANTPTNLTVKNNSLYNDVFSSSTPALNSVNIQVQTATFAFGTGGLNNNNYYFPATNTVARTGAIGTASLATTFFATLANWQAAITPAQDAASIQADPQYVSASDLHIALGSPNVNAGAAGTGVVNDIDGQLRDATPDIGADEPNGVTPPANDIAATAIISPVTGSTLPNGSSVTPQAKFTNVGSATQTNVGVQFTITGPGGYSYTNNQVIASIGPDSSATVTFASAPAFTTAGGYTTTALVTTSDSNPGNNSTGGSFNVLDPLNGPYTVGTGGAFTSLTNPGGLFDALNTLGAAGNVTANITTDLTAETGAIQLNQLPGGFGLTIKPSGAPRTISGNGASLGLIKLFGADNVTIDGSLSGGSDRSLTITYGNTGGAVIWIQAASAANGAVGTTIKNTNLSGNPATTIIAGIISGSGVTLGGPAESPNSNTTIQNNWMYRVQNGIYNQGATTFDQNWNITGNTFGSTVAADKNSFRGMLIGNVQNFVVNGNTISGISSTTTTTAAMSGIQLAFAINGGSIVNNVIRDIRNNSASGTGAYGINVTSTSAAANVTIANNSVSDVAALGSATVTSNGLGINFNATGAAGYKLYHNSVNMNANQGSGTTAALNVAAGVTAAGALDVQNNIFANTQTSGATRYAVYSAAPASVFTPINYNDYFAANVGFIGGSARVTLGDWQAATTQDANSLAVDPLFVGPTNLHISAGSPMIDAAVTIPAVNSDFDGQTRPIGAANDIGADEWVATITISGRVLTSDGQGIKNVLVSLTDSGAGPKRSTLTGPFGYYSFTGQPSNLLYTVSVGSKRFTFTPNFRDVGGYTDITDFDFIADPLP